MFSRSRFAATVTLTVGLAMLSACGDDPVGPPAGPWTDVALPDLGTGGLMSIAARGTRVVAIGAMGSDPAPDAVAVQTTGGPWEVLALPATPADAIFTGVTLDASGAAVLVGAVPSGQPLVLDERSGWQIATLQATGYLNAVIAGRADTVVAVGTASGGLAARSSAPGAWVTDRAGFTTPQEKGLVDVTYADGVFVACGWDDADLQPVLRRYDSAGWKELPGPGSATIPEIRVEHRAVWLGPGGTVWVGGALVESRGPTEIYTARLTSRPSNGDWFEIVLPDAARVEAINDILRTSNGNVYLACGERQARVLRWDGTAWHDEGPGVSGQVLALAESADGRIYAAGYLTDGTGQPHPFLRVR